MNPIGPDPVQRLFARIQQSTLSTTVAPEVDMIIDRAARRDRSRAVLVGGAAILAVAAVVTLVFTGPLRGDRALPVTPTPPLTGTRVDTSQYIHTGFLENSFDADPPVGEPRERRFRDMAVCGVQPVDQLSASGFDDDGWSLNVALYLFADEETARAVMTDLGPELLGCHGFPHSGLVPSQWPSFGDESVGVTYRVAPDGAGELAARGATAHNVAVRVGRAVEYFSAYPAMDHDGTGTILIEASPEELNMIVSERAPQLCLYSAQGCASAPGMPAALSSLSQDGQAWLLELYPYVPYYSAQDAAAGTVIARAGELGYRPMIVTPGCDDSLDASFDQYEDDRARYLALYFADRAQAEEAAAEFRRRAVGEPELTLRIFEVRTRCVD